MAKRRFAGGLVIDGPSDLDEALKITPLGAGQEVGRSCIVLEYKGRSIMLDAGVHPAFNGLAALPFYDEFDLSKIDLLLITHFHLDHAASLPYVMQRTPFRGRVAMTHPTKAIYKWLLQDYIRVSNADTQVKEESLFEEADLQSSYARIEAVDYHQMVDIGNGIRFTAYHAGHVLGAAMFLIELDGIKILYTGDYSREEDRHLMIAEVPPVRPDVLITEATYGVQSLEPRLEKEARFTSLVHQIVSRGGRVLMPVFALGRAQELLLILDQYWSRHPELQSIPIYYASVLATKCMAVYQTYINMMNDRIRKRFAQGRNPFQFRFVSSLKNPDKFQDDGPCVMLASPGMLQNGVSRRLVEKWAPEKKNGLIIAGYCVEGTMARTIMNEPDEIISLDGQRIPRRMSVDYISFSAHVDYSQNAAFIDEVHAPHVVLVHGEANAMGRLKAALISKYSESDIRIYNPRNCETVALRFQAQRIARVLGNLAAKAPSHGQPLKGILISRHGQLALMSSEDLNTHSGLSTSTILQRQHIRFDAPYSLLKWRLEQMYGSVKETMTKMDNGEEGGPGLSVMDTVLIYFSDKFKLTLEWTGTANGDMVADSVLACIIATETSPASIKGAKGQNHEHQHVNGHRDPELWQDDIHKVEMILESLTRHFGSVHMMESEEKDGAQGLTVEVKVDDTIARIDLSTLMIESENGPLARRCRAVVQSALELLVPLANEV